MLLSTEPPSQGMKMFSDLFKIAISMFFRLNGDRQSGTETLRIRKNFFDRFFFANSRNLKKWRNGRNTKKIEEQKLSSET